MKIDQNSAILSPWLQKLFLLSTGCTLISCCWLGVSWPAQAQTPWQAQTLPATPPPTTASTLYVNPSGSDQLGAGTTAASPYRTIAYALQQAAPGTTILLAPGTYSSETGETFPLQLKPGMILRGNPDSEARDIIIRGGGFIGSSTYGKQNATILTARDSQILGLSITNPKTRGTGVWIESTNPVVSNNIFTGNQREGIFVTGSANPTVERNLLVDNSANGITIVGRAQGVFRNNELRRTGFGMAIGDEASPRVVGNLFTENRIGIVLSDSAQPVLRQNQLINNQESGIVLPLFSQAQPDLGTSAESGNNVFQGNDHYGIDNATRNNPILAVGNQLEPSQVSGQVSLQGTTVAGAFSDIGGTWAAPYIQALADQKIVGGFPDRTFRPNTPVTRSQFAAILQQAFNLQPAGTVPGFADVSGNFWAAPAIQAVVGNNFMSGYPGNLFRPNQPISNVQVIVALARGLNLQSPDLSSLSTLSGADRIPDYAREAIAAALQEGIVVNRGEFQPLQEATRAEVAAFVFQALVSAGRVEPIASPTLPGTPPS